MYSPPGPRHGGTDSGGGRQGPLSTRDAWGEKTGQRGQGQRTMENEGAWVDARMGMWVIPDEAGMRSNGPGKDRGS